MISYKGSAGFEEYYKNIFLDRWGKLKESFLNEPNYIEWNPENTKSYFLDSASVLAAYSLPLIGAKNVLDMCAAPGGKSLVLAYRMDSDAFLLCNERSASRRNRLNQVLDEHLSAEVRSRVNISSNDGALMCKRELNSFDAILLDAPCSSERHVIQDKKYLDAWTQARIKNLSFTQWALLSSAFRVLKTEGHIIYSTCALSNVENDFVIKKLLKKFSNASVLDIDFKQIESECSYHLPKTEKTDYGYHVLPDRENGAGPMYFSLIKRLQ